MKYISLHPNRINPTAYYVRVLRPAGGYLAKTFCFSDGGEENALLQAQRFRNAAVLALWGKTIPSGNDLIVSTTQKRQQRVYRTSRANLSSGILGVSHRTIKLQNGGQTHHWVAVWREGGKVRQKSFGYEGQIGKTKNRTSEQAKELAVKYREEMVKQHYLPDL